MVIFERGVNSGFPAANHRWETPLSIVLFSALFMFAGVTVSGVTIHQEPGKLKQNAAKPATTQASPQKHPTWRVKVVEDFGAPFVSVHAKKALFSDVASEIGRQLKLKVPIHVTDKAKQQLLTDNFDDLPLEQAVRRLSPHAVIDYVMNGGADPLYPARKQALVLSVANNLLKAYDPDKVAIEIVAFGPGIDLLFTGSERRKQVESLIAQGVRFDICLNTVDTIEREMGKRPEFIPAATPVQVGVGQILFLAENGYTVVRP